MQSAIVISEVRLLVEWAWQRYGPGGRGRCGQRICAADYLSQDFLSRPVGVQRPAPAAASHDPPGVAGNKRGGDMRATDFHERVPALP